MPVNDLLVHAFDMLQELEFTEEVDCDQCGSHGTCPVCGVPGYVARLDRKDSGTRAHRPHCRLAMLIDEIGTALEGKL